MKKKILSVLLVSTLCLGLSACAGNSDQSTQTADASASQEADSSASEDTEMTEDEMIQETGIDLQAPEGAENVTYSVIDGDSPIAQMVYTYDGHELTERACLTGILSLTGDSATDEDASAEDITNAAEIITNAANEFNITDLDCEFTMGGIQVVSNREAVTQRSDNGPGYIAWLDVVPGILYNLSCEDALDDQQLVSYAEDVFLPMQEDAE